jgi:hypothetical protein
MFATAAMQRYVTEHARSEGDNGRGLLNHMRTTASATFHQTSTCMMSPEPKAWSMPRCV